MLLSELLTSIGVALRDEYNDRTVNNITFDSRKAEEGDIFIAIKGTSVDGHSYIPMLKNNNLSCIVVEESSDSDLYTGFDCPVVKVKDTREALGILASHYFGNPSEKLKLVGVTGTNGKTSVATLIYKMANMMGYKSGLLSTVANYIAEEKIEATHTTPDPITLNRLLSKMVKNGCEIALMEVSSHAADQKRIAGLKFTGGIFTNLTRDHLDYHRTFAAYRDAKKSFFDNLPSGSFALVNKDDKNGEYLLQNTNAKKYFYSLRTQSDFHCKILEKYIDSSLLEINRVEINTRFTGTFNAYNLTAVYGACILLGFDDESVALNLSLLTPVKGRFQTIRNNEGVTAVVDYAHTPDALINVLETIKEINPKGRIISVIGCGGNRDRGKRPIMAKETIMRSQLTILTSDNPRYEDPQDIINDMLEGLEEKLKDKTLIITDRRSAIKTAISLAQANDIVLVAGKGHETYQEIEGVKHHFDDAEEVVKAISILNKI